MRKTVLFFLLFAVFSRAQIINFESMRVAMASNGWFMNLDFGGRLVDTDNFLFEIDSKLNLYWKIDNKRIFFLNNIGLAFANDKDLLNNGASHLRLNVDLPKVVTTEVFLQGQYNAVNQLKFRWLSGLGPRFRILEKKRISLFIGTLYMFEFERLTSDTEHYFFHRLSSYLSVGIRSKKRFSMSAVTYYQPHVADFMDYRILGDYSILFKVSRSVNLGVIYNISYDARPPEGVKNLNQSIKPIMAFNFQVRPKKKKKRAKTEETGDAADGRTPEADQ